MHHCRSASRGRQGLTIDFRWLLTPGEWAWGLVDSLSNDTSNDNPDVLPEFLTLMEIFVLGSLLGAGQFLKLGLGFMV